jgi:hypothetical protein
MVNRTFDPPTQLMFGSEELMNTILEMMSNTVSTITIVTPNVEPKILQNLSQIAYKKKSARYLYITNWDLATYGAIVKKMKNLGNIQFRNLKAQNDFWAIFRDSEEILLCPSRSRDGKIIALYSSQDGYAQMFSNFIYPMFQANSRPV